MKKKVLGRGLKALIPEESQENLKDSIKDIEIEKIFPNPHQPRTVFNEEELSELAESIKEFGIIQPIIVRSRGKSGFELIAGERRLKAAKIAGFTRVPCIVRDAKDSDSILMALVENIHRVNLNPIEEAKAYEALMEDSSITHEDVAAKIKKSRSYVTNIIRLLKLPLEVQDLVVSGKITIGQVRPLIGLSKSQVLVITESILKKGLSSREVENAVKRLHSPGKEKKSKPSAGAEIQEIKEELQKIFGTKVHLNYNKGHGNIVINYYSDEDLNRILDILLKIK